MFSLPYTSFQLVVPVSLTSIPCEIRITPTVQGLNAVKKLFLPCSSVELIFLIIDSSYEELFLLMTMVLLQAG